MTARTTTARTTRNKLHKAKVALYTQQTYVGLGLGLGLGLWLTDMLCNCWVYEASRPYVSSLTAKNVESAAEIVPSASLPFVCAVVYRQTSPLPMFKWLQYGWKRQSLFAQSLYFNATFRRDGDTITYLLSLQWAPDTITTNFTTLPNHIRSFIHWKQFN